MFRCRKAMFRCLAAFCVALFLIDSTASAKKTKDPTGSPTEVPTGSPSSNPTISMSPSVAPSASPTFFPTATPTKTPTDAPTKKPTDAPTKKPTDAPTQAPTEELTTLPPRQEKMIMISLFPILTFDVILSDNDASIEELFLDFLDDVLEEVSSTYRFEYSHVVLNALVQTTDQSRSSGTEYRITIDGVVYYFDETPTMEVLSQSLNAYFSLLGASNLQNYLTSNGFEEADVVSIYIGNDKVQFADNEEEEEEKEKEKKNIFVNDEGKISKRNVVGFYVLFVVVAVTIALIVIRILIGRRRREKEERLSNCRENNGSNIESSTKSSEQNDEESGVASSKLHSATTKVASNTSRGKKFSNKLPTITTEELLSKSLTIPPEAASSEDIEKPAPPSKESEEKPADSKTGKTRRSQVMKKRIEQLSARNKVPTKEIVISFMPETDEEKQAPRETPTETGNGDNPDPEGEQR